MCFNSLYPLPPEGLNDFSKLTSLCITGLSAVFLPELPFVISLKVVLEQAAGRARRATFRVDKSPRLRKILLHYKGAWVPRISCLEEIGAFFIQRDAEVSWEDMSGVPCEGCGTVNDFNTFELRRVPTASETRAGVMALSKDSGSGLNIKSDLGFLSDVFCCLLLDGVPDWILKEYDFSETHIKALTWKRWSHSGPLLLTATDTVRACGLTHLNFVTDIEDYTLPLWPDLEDVESLVIVSLGYGFSLNGLLSYNAHNIKVTTLSITCPPYNPHKQPMVINQGHEIKYILGPSKNIHLSGHIMFNSLQPPPMNLEYRHPVAFSELWIMVLDITSQLADAYDRGEGGITFAKSFFCNPTQSGAPYRIQFSCQEGFLSVDRREWTPYIRLETAIPSTRTKMAQYVVVVDKEIQYHSKLFVNQQQCLAPYSSAGLREGSLMHWRSHSDGVIRSVSKTSHY